MDQHSIILVLTLIIAIVAICLAVKYGSGEQFRRACDCNICSQPWANANNSGCDYDPVCENNCN